MENKTQKTKISLSTIFLVIAITLIIIMGVSLYESNQRITKLEKNISEINSNQNQEANSIQDLTNKEITGKVDAIAKKFVSENPQISFQYPNNWTIEKNDWNIWNRTVKAPEDGVRIIIKKEENIHNLELKEFINLDWGSIVLKEGTFNIGNYDAYYKTYTFGDANYYIKAKKVILDSGKGDYFSISLVIGGGDNLNIPHEELFEKYETELDNLISSIQL